MQSNFKLGYIQPRWMLCGQQQKKCRTKWKYKIRS